MEPSRPTLERPISRRTIVRGGIRLAYAAPLISATYGLAPLRAGAADDALSSEQAIQAAEQAAAENQPPVAVPGEGFEVTDADADGFETVTVDGSASADPDGKIVSFLWTFRDEWVGDRAVVTVTLPVGTHRLELTVTDDQGATDSRRVRIRVHRGEQSQEQEPQQDTAQDSAPAEPTPVPEPTLPPTPYDLRAKQKFVEVALTWQANPGTPAPIRVYRTVDDGLNRPLDELPWVLLWEEWSQPSYRDAAVEIGVPYRYVVRSFDGSNESERSNVAAITLAPVEPPVEEAPVEEVPVEEVPVEEPVDEPVVEEPVEEAPVEAAAADEPPVEESSADENS